MIRRRGNCGVVELHNGEMATFSIGGSFGHANYSQISGASHIVKQINVSGYSIVPMGSDNNMPGKVMALLDGFYAGEGILGKIQGLQWGQGPELFKKTFAANEITRDWTETPESKDIKAWLSSWNYKEFLMRCMIDLSHMQGFFYRGFLNKGARIGLGRISKLEHIPIHKARIEAPKFFDQSPSRIIMGDWPHPSTELFPYPIFDRFDPFKHRVFMDYRSVYSFGKEFFSTPRFMGAFDFLELAGMLAPLLISYNKNASSISFHIESPGEYWDTAEERLKDKCKRTGAEYSPKMLDEFMDESFEKFSSGITGMANAGKFLHTQSFYSDIAQDFTGWKITPLDKKVKEFIDAMIATSNKADSAASSAFGLHPSLANITVDGKLSSGSELLYALKQYYATETAIPEYVLFGPINDAIKVNFPGTEFEMGFYHDIVRRESQVSPSQRVTENV